MPTPHATRPLRAPYRPQTHFYVVIEAGSTAPVVTPHPPAHSRVVAGPYDDYPEASRRAAGLARNERARRIANAEKTPLWATVGAWTAMVALLAFTLKEIIAALQ